MSVSAGPKIADNNGLIFYVDAGNTKSYPGEGEIWYDLSGQDNHANLVGGVAYSSDNGGQLQFDGVDDYAEATLSGITIFDTDLTYECFFRRPTTFDGWRTVINIKRPNGGGVNDIPFIEFRTDANTRNVRGLYYDGTDRLTDSYTGVADGTTFVHAVGVSKGTNTLEFYINGSLFAANTTNYGGAELYTDPVISIGRAYSTNRSTDIDVTSVKVYNRALTEDEITFNFEAFRDRVNI